MDISQLLKSLNDQRVEYVIIGATAFPTHGYARATADIDILIKPTKENARRVLNALAQVGYDVTNLAVAEVLKNKILFRQYILATDIHPSAVGATFETIWKNRVKDKNDNAKPSPENSREGFSVYCLLTTVYLI